MGSLGAPELIIIILAVMLLVGYKKLPDASRSIGRSLRIFKGEMKGLREDDGGSEAAAATTVREPLAVTAAASSVPVDEAERLVEEARAAEARAAELRARADTARAAQAVPPAEGPR